MTADARRVRSNLLVGAGGLLAFALLVALGLPLIALAVSTSLDDLRAGQLNGTAVLVMDEP